MAEEATTTTEEPETETPEAPASPDFSEQFANLDQRFDQLIDRLPAEEPPQATDLMDDYDDEDEDDDDYLPDPGDSRLDQIESYIAGKEAKERAEALRALADKYEDFQAMVPEIREVLDDMGIFDPAERGNPKLAEAIYKSLKADAEAAAETPAEEARSTGARIETGAGASPAEAEPDPYESLIEGFGKKAEDRSVFD